MTLLNLFALGSTLLFSASVGSLQIISISGETITVPNSLNSVADLRNSIEHFDYQTFITADGARLNSDDPLPPSGTLTMVTSPKFSNNYPDHDLLNFVLRNPFRADDVNSYIDEKGRGILQHAVRAADLPAVQKLLDMGADVNGVDHESRNSLFVAFFHHEETRQRDNEQSKLYRSIMFILLQHGGNIDANFGDRDFNSDNYQAVFGRYKFVRNFQETIEKDGEHVEIEEIADFFDLGGETTSIPFLNLFKYENLLQFIANLAIEPNFDFWIRVLMKIQNEKGLEFFVQHAPLEVLLIMNDSGSTMLHNVILKNFDAEILRSFDVQIMKNFWRHNSQFLNSIIRTKNMDAFSIFLRVMSPFELNHRWVEYDRSYRKKCVNKRYILHVAAEAENHAVVELLVELEADVNVKNQEGMTPLQKLPSSASKALVKLLTK